MDPEPRVMDARPAGAGRPGAALGFALAAIAAAALLPSAPAAAQETNPVYVDDSPRAWELYRLAREQARDNVGEAARLYQELLDGYALRLVPVDESSPDHFVAVRAAVLRELAGDERLRLRYQAIESTEARRLVDSGALVQAAITRSMTGPGLDALLRLAQESIEAGRFRAALGWLQEASAHPLLDAERAAHCWFMVGLAAHYLEDGDRLDEALRALAGTGPAAESLVPPLRRLAAEGAPPAPLRGVSTLDRTEAAGLGELVAEPIWSAGLGDPAPPPGPEGDAAARILEARLRSGSLLTAVATATATSLFVGDGVAIQGLDRFTGRALWPPHVAATTPEADRSAGQPIADLNVVAVEGPFLVAISGHAYAAGALGEREVVCLDGATGRLRWSARIDRLTGGGELEELVPHGAPLVAEGGVYLLARKVSPQLLTSCYAIALELEDGTLRWARHVASSGGIRQRLARPFSSPVYHDGDVVVATAIGAVARIRADTGETRWLRRYHPPLTPYLPEDRRPWEISAPLVTARGVTAIRPDLQAVVRLDWETGDELEALPALGRDGWNGPRYLLADGQSVYGVGSDVRAFAPAALRQPVWVFPSAQQSERIEPAGRVGLSDAGVLVPTTDGLYVLDPATGIVEHHLPLGGSGNPLAAGPQLLVATHDSLKAYMPFGRAEEMLREQMASAPDDPGPALALMRLGIQVRDVDLTLEVADRVIGTMGGAEADPAQRRSRQELFDILLQLDRQKLASTELQGERLHAAIGVVAQEPAQQVEHLLAKGDWLASRSRGRAVESWQSILSRDLWAATPLLRDGSVRPGSAWAADRLGAMVRDHGIAVYQAQSDLARRRLEALRASSAATQDELLAVARAFPFADAAVDAGLVAAGSHAAKGDLRRAVGTLLWVYRQAPDQQRAARLLGTAVSWCEQAGWPRQAESVLRHVVDSYGDIALQTPAGPRNAARWLAELRPGRTRPRLGEIRPQAHELPGTLVAGSGLPLDRALLREEGGKLRLYSSQGGPGSPREEWSFDLELPGETTVLRFDDDRLLLWVIPRDEPPRAFMLDPRRDAPQRVLWTGPPIGGVVRDGPPGVAADRFQVGRPIPLVSSSGMLVVGEARGSVTALDLRDGRQVWHRPDRAALHQIDLGRAHDLGLVFAGWRKAGDRPEPVPALVVLDPASGETLHEIRPLGGSEVRWLEAGPLGELVYGTAAGVEAADLLGGETLWATVTPEARDTPRAWAAPRQVIIEGAPGRASAGPAPIYAVRYTDGAVTGPFDAPAGGEWDRADLKDVIVADGRIVAHYSERIVCYHAGGAVLGADRISDDHDYEWLFVAEDRLPLVSRHRQEPGAQAGQPARHIYRLYTLSDNGKLLSEHELQGLESRLQRAAAIDGWLLLSTATGTLAIGLPGG